MITPPPVDISKLKHILGNAKKVMAKTEQISPTYKPKVSENISSQEYNEPYYDENDEKELNYGTDLENKPVGGLQNYTKEQVMASNLPPAIKEAMINKPIIQLQGPPSNFTLEDMGELVDKPKQARRPIRENTNSDMITISKKELKEMIDERINQIIMNNYTKTITEQAIKKTITTLINEGKLTVKKKTI